MSTMTENAHASTMPATGTRLQRAMRWLDQRTQWAMDPATTVATRQRLLTEQWSRSVTPEQVTRELVR